MYKSLMNSIQPVAPGSLVCLVTNPKTPIYTRHVECEACDANIEIQYTEEYEEDCNDSHDVVVDRECPKCHCDIYAVSCR